MHPFEPVRIRYDQGVYNCLAHAQWACYLSRVGLRFSYAPKPMYHDWPGTERYKIGSKTRTVVYGPVFQVAHLGYVDIVEGTEVGTFDQRPQDESLQLAERYSGWSGGETVYVIQGTPEVPYTWKRPKNECVVIRHQERYRYHARLQHNGRRFYIAVGEDHVYSPVLLDAATRAEMMADLIVDKYDSNKPEALL